MTSYSDVRVYTRIRNRNLTCDEFTNQVHWSHIDGSKGCWTNAFIEVYDDWFIIYTEHHSYFIYHKTDLLELQEVNLEDRTVINYVELQMHQYEDDECNNELAADEDYNIWSQECEGYKGTILE